MAKDGVKLLDFWGSPYAMRAKIALAEKGVDFEAQEEDLFGGKSELLLTSNPIYQRVPVLLHNGNPVLESANILTYIDEAWASPPLLPSCIVQRARARFWTHFVDDKIFSGGRDMWLSKGGDELEVAKKEFIETLKLLEGALGEKPYFGGDSFGYLDIVIIPFTSWFLAYEKYGGFKVEDYCPKFTAWAKTCLLRKSVSKVLPPPENICGCVAFLRKMHGMDDN